ncbi:MAG: hypothetical protein QGD90_06925 [Candidatus Hydrogenedentes bacterium]|nr:hypothetical protein [Candidatus Hydrogenedentota bacterium]
MGATITGVQVTVERHSATGNLQSNPAPFAQLVKPDGNRGGIEGWRLDGDNWGTEDSVVVLGGPGDLWALDLTRDEINDPAFTVVYSVTTSLVGDPDEYFVDAITAEVFFDPPLFVDPVEPCDTIGRAIEDYPAFSAAFAGGTNDLDADELPDSASLALMEAVVCDPFAAESMSAALFDAYNVNLIVLEGEADLSVLDSEAAAAGVQDVRSLVAFLAAGSASLEAAVKDALAMSDPPIMLTGDYGAVTSAVAECEPPARATNEPFSATGDLDGDCTDNLTEYNNVIAQGGVMSDFVIAATSPGLDGSEPIRTPGGPSGGCLIATAAYGTPLAAEIDTLRALRDGILLRGALGTAFVDTYYRVSPPIARRVADNSALAAIVRYALIPVLFLAELVLEALQPAAYALAALILLATFQGRRRRKARAR